MSNSVINVESLVKKLDRLGVDAEKAVKQSMSKNIEEVKGAAKALCPVDSGDLRGSIYKRTVKKKGKIQGIVYTNKEYAPYVEFGTGRIGEATNGNTEVNLSYKQDWKGRPAVPFMYPALKNNEESVLDNIKEDLRKALREIARR
ncbi:MAG: HK97-gp10 family putative phage morphogenesis protein [Clostridium sp.]|uniref:HK97-gp10 family putative phage morphogenesis protein n=1 Tax=Clostridium sp. TaxID=1506 RepID=UPI003F38CB04